MLAYTFKRLLTLIPTLLAASILVFLFVHLIPGDPAAILLGDTATPEEVAQLSAEMGFDRPLWIQYLCGSAMCFKAIWAHRFLSRASLVRHWQRSRDVDLTCDDDDGLDHYHRPAHRHLSATKHGTWIDQITSSGAMLAASIPTFWLGLYLIMIFSVTLGWFPSSGFRRCQMRAAFPTCATFCCPA